MSFVVIGAQWGDEGKGKIVDLLSERVDAVVRFQGGPNAGHTVSVGGRKTFLHHIPTGILRPHCLCLLGNGMVVDPDGFLEEVENLKASGLSVDGRLFLSHRAHLILPHHRALDGALEDEGTLKIGTTRRGVGHAYQAKAARVGIRPADLDEPEELRRRLSLALEAYGLWRRRLPSLPEFELDEMIAALAEQRVRLAPYLDDTVERLQSMFDAGRRILFEGSQGTMLDADHGTYPFVTSSQTVLGAACAGAGAGPGQINGGIGVFKAYATRVGEGPMPSEETGNIGEALRERGREFGTTTGRPRRCGWFDAVAARYASRLNGLRAGALTLLDVLDSFEEIKVVTGYVSGGEAVVGVPASSAALAACEPEYTTFPGWQSDTTACREWSALPANARAFVEGLEERLGIRFAIVSVGPDRDQTIIRDPGLLDELVGEQAASR